MARDPGLEHLLSEYLAGTQGLSEKAMFGGRAWLMDGNLLCGARDTGALVRLGKGNDGWALKISGVEQMIMHGRPMAGWVRVAPEIFGDEDLGQKFIKAALDFVRTLPPK
jgi:TfoX N-terminal domain